MTVYLVISLPIIPYVNRIYMVLANPTNKQRGPTEDNNYTSFWRSPSHGAQPLGLPSSHQSSHQGTQARPAHPPPPKLAQ